MFMGEAAHPSMAAVKAPTTLGWWLQGTRSRARISPVQPTPARKILLHNPEHKEKFMSRLTGCPSECCLSVFPRAESLCWGHCLNAKGEWPLPAGHSTGSSPSSQGGQTPEWLLPERTDPRVTQRQQSPSPAGSMLPCRHPHLPPADPSLDSRRLRQAGAAEEAGRTKRSGLANLFSSF